MINDLIIGFALLHLSEPARALAYLPWNSQVDVSYKIDWAMLEPFRGQGCLGFPDLLADFYLKICVTLFLSSIPHLFSVWMSAPNFHEDLARIFLFESFQNFRCLIDWMARFVSRQVRSGVECHSGFCLGLWVVAGGYGLDCWYHTLLHKQKTYDWSQIFQYPSISLTHQTFSLALGAPNVSQSLSQQHPYDCCLWFNNLFLAWRCTPPSLPSLSAAFLPQNVPNYA